MYLIAHDEASFGLSQAIIVRETNGGTDGMRLDDIFNHVDKDVSRMGVMDVNVIISELFLHQKEGLAWLVKREISCDLPPFWVERSDGVYINEMPWTTVFLRVAPTKESIVKINNEMEEITKEKN